MKKIELQILQYVEKLCHAVYAVDQCICIPKHHVIPIPVPGLVLPRPTKSDLLAGIVIFLVIVFCLHKGERAYLGYNHDRYCSHFLVTGQQNFQFLQVVVSDNHVLTAIIVLVLAALIKPLPTLQHPTWHILMMVDDLAFSNPVQCRNTL